MPRWLAHRGACYACAETATGDCRLCGSDTCPDHAARLPGSGLAACLDCHRALGAPGASPPAPATPCVLIADDSFRLRLLLARALQLQGFEVLEAIDGDRALEAILAERPDVAVLDEVMPGLDGFEVCRAVRAEPDVQGMPIILMSGNATEAEARAAGADVFLAKPFLPSALLDAVSRLARARRSRAVGP